MEDILDLYAAPYDPQRLVVCFDERPMQRLGEVYEPWPTAPGKPRREDHEYERHGMCHLLRCFDPRRGWREVRVRERRTAQEFAWQMKWLVDDVYPEAEVIRVVLDNLNTHTPAAFYKTLSLEEARRLTQKLEFHYTPKHGPLAEHGGDRIFHFGTAVFAPAMARRSRGGAGGVSLDRSPECGPSNGRSALYDFLNPREVSSALPQGR